MSVISPTKVVFTQSQWQLSTIICLSVDLKSQGTWFVTEQTPFHPVSHIWPDHPADHGEVTCHGQHYTVTDCQVGAVNLETQTLYIGKDIPVKRDTEGWVFVVVHHIAENGILVAGDSVTLDVDRAYQQALSRGHSGGHLSSLALNQVLHNDFWRKQASRIDALGSYDFHSYAQEKSIVSENCSTDHYRLGKTLRKRGLNSAELLVNLDLIAERINQQLAVWLDLNTPVLMRREGDTLTDSRYWQCDLGNDGIIEIPCGGTHITTLAEYSQLTVCFEIISEQEIIMTTHAVSS